ncbi:hypothetical protein N0V85_005697 [Neurospora sp. IMI 360204]|nr:hypothetical protein N0V85_005697 [Neurospora sp. IMI 360204]
MPKALAYRMRAMTYDLQYFITRKFINTWINDFHNQVMRLLSTLTLENAGKEDAADQLGKHQLDEQDKAESEKKKQKLGEEVMAKAREEADAKKAREEVDVQKAYETKEREELEGRIARS